MRGATHPLPHISSCHDAYAAGMEIRISSGIERRKPHRHDNGWKYM